MEINYRIKNLEEISYKVDLDSIEKDFDPSTVDFRLGHGIKVDKEESEISVSVYISIVEVETESELVREGVQAVFEVNPFDEVVTCINDDGIEVSAPQLIDTFINVTIGAARGIMAKNLKGTALYRCILPLIPMQIIRKNSLRK